MALVFAAEIGDLEQVKSIVQSSEDRANAVKNSLSQSRGEEGDLEEETESDPKSILQAKVELLNTFDQKKGKTALMAAISQGHYAVAEYLLSIGADPSVQTAEGVDALMLACSLHGKTPNHPDLVQVLLLYGANVRNRDRKHDTALHYACRKGCLRSVKLLVTSSGLELNPQNLAGIDPLMIACSRGFQSIAETLCQAGARLGCSDGNGNTALHFAAKSGTHGLVPALQQFSANVEAENSQGLTPLKIASAMGHTDFVQELLLCKASLKPWDGTMERQAFSWTERGRNPRSAIVLASSNGHMDTLHLLLSHRLADSSQDAFALSREVAEAARLALLNCQEDIYKYLHLFHQQGIQGFPSKQALVSEKERKLHKVVRFRRKCKCEACLVFFGDDLLPATLVPSQSNDAGQLSYSSGDTSQPLPLGQSINGRPASPDCGSPDVDVQQISSAVLAKEVEARTSSLSFLSEASSLAIGSSTRDTRSPSTLVGSGMTEVQKAKEEDVTVRQNVKQGVGAATSNGRTRRRERKASKSRVRAWRPREKKFDPLKVLDAEDPGVKNDVLRIIGAYLQAEGYTAASLTLQDEAQIKLRKRNEMHDMAQHIFELISQGGWAAISKFNTKQVLGRNNRRFLYALHKQEYLELISRGENERAFSFLHKKLKPLEAQSKAQGNQSEFADLCYLLTCKSVHDAPSFRNWDATSARDKLAEDFKTMVLSEYSSTEESSLLARSTFVDKNRLVHLLQQAVAYQLEFSSSADSGVTPRIDTLLEDFESIAVPETLCNTFIGHTHNVKCVEFLGEEGRLLASGSSDRTIMIWKVQDDIDADHSSSSDSEGEDDGGIKSGKENTIHAGLPPSSRAGGKPGEQGERMPMDLHKSASFDATLHASSTKRHRGLNQREPEIVIRGHKSRIWNLTSDRSGRWLCSASGDNTVRMWDVWSCLEESGNTKQNGVGPLVLQEAPGHTLVKTGHEGDIYAVEFHYDQIHLATAGYDKTVRLVNLQTNQIVKAFHGHTSAVTDVKFNPFGNLIISASKDSTVKFWDTVSGVCIKTFFQPVGEVTSVDVSRDGLQVLSSSKDSSVRLWDVRTGRAIRRFRGYQNSSLNFVRTAFGPREALVFSGSEDGKVYAWDTHTGNLLAKLRSHGGPVFHTAWNSSQSMLASCSEDGTVKTWRAKAL